MGKVVKKAFVGAVIGVGIGLATGGLAWAAAGGALLRQFATNAVLGFVANALAPKPPTAQDISGQSVMGRNPLAPRKIAYGEVKTSGAIVFLEATGDKNKYLHLAVTLAGHEINAVKSIYIGETLAGTTFSDATEVASITTSDPNYASYAKFTPHYGSSDQLADTNMVSRTSWSDAHRLRGISYIYSQLTYNKDVYDSGMPNISAVIEGKKVYDPRTGLTEYSNNAALCILDYLRDDKYGLAAADEEIDFTSFTAAANICDEPVGLYEGGSESRYQINGLIDTSRTPSAILSDMAAACGGIVYYANGQWKMKAGAYVTPTSTLSADDIVGEISITTRVSNQSNFNAVKGVFLSPDDNWQPVDFPALTSDVFESEDGGLRTYTDMTLPLTTSSFMAQRLAKIALYRNREQLSITVPCKLTAFKYEVGDTLMLTYDRLGFSSKAFEVVSWTLGINDNVPVINLTLKETSSTVYSWSTSDETALTRNNTILPSSQGDLDILGLEINSGGKTQPDGTFISSLLVSWTEPDNPFLNGYVVEWKPALDTSWSSTTTENTSIEIAPVIEDVEYTVRVKAVTVLGNTGGFSSSNAIAGGDSIAPASPTSLSASGGIGYIKIKWTNPTDYDLAYVEVYEADEEVFASSSMIATSAGDTFVRTNLTPNTVKYYWLKAVDYTGNKSAESDSVFGQSAFISSNDIGDAVIGYDKFADDVTGLLDTIQSDVSGKVDSSDYNLTLDYQQVLEDSVNQLSTDALELALKAGALNTRMNDAGIVVDPSTGEVTISAVSTLGDTVNDLSVDLNAVEGELLLKASTTYVNDAIAAAVLDSADLASLNELEARVDTAEIDINSLEGSITLTSTGSLYDVNDDVLGVEALEGRISINEGAIELKASQVDLDDVSGRVSTAEIQLNSIDIPSITQSVVDTAALYDKIDDLGELTLQQALGRYNDRKYVSQDIAFAREQLTADVNDQKEAIAQAKLELGAQIDENVATITSTQTALADEVSARAASVLELQADIDGVSSDLSVNYYTAAEIDSSISAAITDLSSTVDDNTASITEILQVTDGIEAKYAVSVDTNGVISGIELISGGGTSAFNVRADQFAIFDSGGNGGDLPFTVFTQSRTINGVTYPAGTYIQNAYIDDAAIVALNASKITAGTMSSADGNFLIDLDNKRIYIA